MASFFLSLALVNALHLSIITLAAVIGGCRVVQVNYGLGPTILRTKKVIRAVPFMGSVKLQGDNDEDDMDLDPERSFKAKPTWIRVSIALSACLTIGLVSVVASGAITQRDIYGAFINPFIVALSPTGAGYQLLLQFKTFLDASEFSQVLGFTALYMAAFNFLPIPLLNGGAAIMELLPLSDKSIVILNSIGLVSLFLFVAGWGYALINAVLTN